MPNIVLVEAVEDHTELKLQGSDKEVWRL